MFGGIDLARAKIGNQQLIAAKHVKRQIAVVVVIAVEEALLLIAVDWHVSRIEVENQLLRRRFVRSDELADEFALNRPGQLGRGAVLEAAQGRRRGRRFAATERRLQCRIVPPALVVIQVFMTLHDFVNTLSQQIQCAVLNEFRIAVIRQQRCNAGKQSKMVVDLSKQKQSSIAGDVATVEIQFDLAA